MNAADSPSQRERQLPNLDTLDVQSLKALVLAKQAELDSRTTEIENLKLLILKLKRMHFGPRSKKYDHEIKQLELRLEDLEASQAAVEPPPPLPATVVLKQQAPRKPARRPLPAALPGETQTIAPEPEKCPDCGGTLRRLGEDVSETLEYAPARFKVIRTVRPKLSCAGCSQIVQAPVPNRPIDCGLAGPGLLAHVLVSKYADHLPLYRQAEIYQREGVELDRSTLADWVGGVSRTLQPLVDALKKYVLGAEKLHGDDVYRCWRRVTARRRPGACRPTFAMIGQRATKQRRQCGSPTRRIGKGSIRRDICRTTRASCRPMATQGSRNCMRRAASWRQRAGPTSDANSTICTRRIDPRSRKRRWSESPNFTVLNRTSGADRRRRGRKSGKPDREHCWRRCLFG
jgi:transposase